MRGRDSIAPNAPDVGASCLDSEHGGSTMNQVTASAPTFAGSPTASGALRPRLEAVDLLRGVVMILMALDHVRDFFTASHFNPLDLTQTTPALFLTRWITHFCAPVFIFLAGTSALLSRARGKTRSQLAWFLLTRGVWLVVLEFTLVHFGWCFFDYRWLVGQVIWATGCGMMALAGLIFLPPWVVTVLGAMLIVGRPPFEGLASLRLEWLGPLWKFLVDGGFLEWRGLGFYVAYPLLPWLGVLLLGYGCGSVWLRDRGTRRRRLFTLGISLTLAFIVLRAANGYGDPHPWSYQATGLRTALSFLNCEKYPPSLLYVFMILGPAIMLLAWWDRKPGPLGRVLVTFGRVPLFYYLLHVPLIHLLAVAFAYARYGETGFMLQNVFLARSGGGLPANYGYSLSVVYLVWLGVVLSLYPACRWFAALKSRRRYAWLSYL